MSVDSCGVTAPSTADSKLPICSWLVAWLRLELGSLSPWSWSVFPLCPADCWLAWDLHQTCPGRSCAVGGLWKGEPGTVHLWLPELPAEAQTTVWSAPTPSHNSCPRDPRHLESGRGWVLLCLREKWMQASDGRRGLLRVEGLRMDRNQCIVGNAPSIYVPNARANCGHHSLRPWRGSTRWHLCCDRSSRERSPPGGPCVWPSQPGPLSLALTGSRWLCLSNLQPLPGVR